MFTQTRPEEGAVTRLDNEGAGRGFLCREMRTERLHVSKRRVRDPRRVAINFFSKKRFCSCQSVRKCRKEKKRRKYKSREGNIESRDIKCDGAVGE